jgi:hypothetical protein
MAKKPTFTTKVIHLHPGEGDPVGVNLNNFYSLMNKAGAYIFIPCRDIWPRTSVDARLPPQQVLTAQGTPKRVNGKLVYQPASKWLDQNRPVEAMTWCPGQPLQITDRLISMGGWIQREGVSLFNLYRPPRIELGDASKADFWRNHVDRIYPLDAEHIIRWCAHRVQHPGGKLNHALFLGGGQGIGKDTMLEPLKEAVGRWNFLEIAPKDLLAPFNPFARSVVLRINEAHDLGEFDRFKFYDRVKVYIVVPIDVLRVNEKHLPEHYVPNVCGVIITSNHKSDGIYLEPDDRRHYVAWSECTKEEFTPEYWNTLWARYHAGGFADVAAYLMAYDLAGFDPMATPPRTAAWHEIVNVNRAPEDAELMDAIDKLGQPDPNDPGMTFPPETLLIVELVAVASSELAEALVNPKHRRAIPHRLERCGYIQAPNPGSKQGLWKINGKRQMVYVATHLSPDERALAVRRRVGHWTLS